MAFENYLLLPNNAQLKLLRRLPHSRIRIKYCLKGSVTMKPVSEWDLSYTLSLPYGEFDWLEVKGRRSIDLTLQNVNESACLSVLSKTISALANTDGGQMIYGLENPTSHSHSWIVDDEGVSRSIKQGTREWLETIIPHQVDPMLTRFNVYEILLETEGRAIYVIDVPQSDIAPHQASDNRYYARVAGHSKPIGHRLVADIMGRKTNPKIKVSFTVQRIYDQHPFNAMKKGSLVGCFLCVIISNIGKVFAEHISVTLHLPKGILHPSKRSFGGHHPTLNSMETDYITITNRADNSIINDVSSIQSEAAVYEPLFPQHSIYKLVRLTNTFNVEAFVNKTIHWHAYATPAFSQDDSTPIESLQQSDSISGIGLIS